MRRSQLEQVIPLTLLSIALKTVISHRATLWREPSHLPILQHSACSNYRIEMRGLPEVGSVRTPHFCPGITQILDQLIVRSESQQDRRILS